MKNNDLHSDHEPIGTMGAEATLQLLKTTINSSLDMIQVFEAVRNEEGSIVDFIWVLNNNASIRIYGDVIGKSLLTLQPGVVEEGIFDAFKQVVETGIPQQYEKHYVHEQFDGWFYQSAVKMNDGVATTTANITELKKAEQEKRESKAMLQDVIDAPNIGIAVYKAVRNEKGDIIDFVHGYINRASIAMLGGEDFTGRLFTAHGENATVQLPQFIEVLQTGKGNSYTRQADFRGRKVWFAITNTPLDSERLVHTWEDVTERKNAEAEILRLKDEVAQKATDKYYSVFNSIDEGFCIFELLYNHDGKAVDWRFMEVNPAFKRQTGLDDVIGKTGRELAVNSEPFWVEAYDTVLKTRKATHFEEYHPETGRWYDVYASPVGHAGNHLVATVFKDITDRKHFERQQDYLLKLGDAIRYLEDPVSIEETATKLALDYFDADRCYYCTIEDQVVTIKRDALRGDLSPVAGIYPLHSFALFQNAIDAGCPLIVDDSHTTEILDEGLRAIVIGLNIRSYILIPVVKDDRTVGLFCLVQSNPRAWKEAEVGLAIETAERTWAAVERAKAQEALRKSQDRFYSIANLVPDLLWDSEPDGCTNWYNDRWLEYTGQSLEVAKGWGWVEAIHPDDREGSARRYAKAVEAGKLLMQEHRIRRHDGAYRWFVVNAFPIKDDHGNVVKMYGAATDIHDSKTAQEALDKAHKAYRIQLEREVRERTLELVASREELEREQHFLEQVTDKAPLLIYVYDLGEERFSYINKRVEELIGKSEEYVYAMGPHLFQAILHPEDLSRYTAYMKGLRDLSGGEVTENDFRVWNGTQFRWFRSRDSVFREEKKHVLQVIGIAEDVTYEKMLEEKLQSKGPIGLN